MKHVVSISLGSPARDHAVEIRLLGEQVRVERRGTNGDLARAIALYRELDGTVDAFGVGGIEFYLSVANRRYYWRDAKRIRAAVRRSKIGDGNGVRPILARRAVTALERHLREQGHTLRDMTVLKTTAVARYFLAQALTDAGCDVVLGDFMFTLGLPLPVKSLAAARALARVLLPAVTQLPYRWLYTLGEEQVRPPTGKWASHYAGARIIAGDYLQIREHMPADLRGKIVITNTTTARDVEDLRQRGVWLLVTETPRLNGRTFGSNVVEGMLLALLDKPQEDVTPEDFEALIERIPLEPALEVLNTSPVWGETPTDDRSHHREHGFLNPWPAPPRASVLTQIRYVSSRLSRFMLRGGNGLTGLPDVVLAPATSAAADTDTVTWVGQSTVLVRHSGRAVLTDPHWSPRAGPWYFGPKRLRPPGLSFDALPPIDVVLISHDHFDHLDARTVRRLRAAHQATFVVPLGVGSWLRGLDIRTDIVELDWWQSARVRGLDVTCTPAQHYGQRSPWDVNQRLWCGWSVKGEGRTWLFTGDTGYASDVFRTIGERLGPFDFAAIPIGTYDPPALMQPSHCAPEQALAIARQVGARRMLAVHWGTFDLSDEPSGEPPVRLRAEAARVGMPDDAVWVFGLGETRAW